MLLEIGHASKMQADHSSFFDAERWKQEGQIEKLKSYLKVKEEEMKIAKLQGNVRLYKELNMLSKQLDSEVYRNSETLPVLAKIIIDHDSSANSSFRLSDSTSYLNNRSSRLIRRKKWPNENFNNSSNLHLISSNQSPSKSLSISQNSSGDTNSFPLVKSTFDLQSSLNLNSLLKITMNNLTKKRENTDSPQVYLKTFIYDFLFFIQSTKYDRYEIRFLFIICLSLMRFFL